MNTETKEQQLQWLLDAWEKNPGDNLASSLARVMRAYGHDADSMEGLEAYMDVGDDRQILVINIGDTQFLFQAHMYLPDQAERLLADIEYTISNYY